MWDITENSDFRSDCILGYFRNHDTDDISRLGEKFGMLTAVKASSPRYEENYGRRWNHFRAATIEEVRVRTRT